MTQQNEQDMARLNTMLKDEKSRLVAEVSDLKTRINEQSKEIIMLERGRDQYQEEKTKNRDLKKANQDLAAKLSNSEQIVHDYQVEKERQLGILKLQHEQEHD